MNLFQNLDLLAINLAVAGTVVLGFTVYFSDRKSITNTTFLLFSLVSAFWSALTYFGYKVEPNLGLWFTRISLSFAVWQAFFLLQLFIVFPQKEYRLSKTYRLFVIPITIITSLIAITPLVLDKIKEVSSDGRILQISNGPAISLFGIMAVGFVVVGIFSLLRKTIKSKRQERKPFIIMLLGVILMFALIITFNFVFPAILGNSDYISLAGLSILPFVICTTYAIFRHKLLNIKVIGAALMVFILSVVAFTEIVVSQDLTIIILRSCVFLLVLIFGTFLIKSVFREVEQREKIEKLAKDLERANEKLKELDQLKSEFLSLATHQIRAPLTAIKGYSSMLLEGDFGILPQKARDSVSTIMKSCQNLIDIVEDFLNISRIEQGRMVYDKSVFNVVDLTKEVVKELEPNVKNAGLSLDFKLPGEENLKINADKNKLKQVIANIIDNAIKYTKEGGISVSVSRNGVEAQIVVKDSGVGIDKADMGKLFAKFSRARGANKVNTHGTGLGLYIAKKIIEAHSGDIRVSSEGTSKGSTFVIELPIYHSMRHEK